jgi:hypothetical protein
MFRAYALAPETVQRFMRRLYWRFQAMVTLTFAIFGIYLAFLGGPVNWRAAGPIVAVIALAYFFIIFFNYRSQLRLLYSLRYEIDGSSITYRQVGQDPRRISRADITRVEERKDGLLVEMVDEGGALRIPYGLARGGDVDFRTTLGAWLGVVPVTARKRPSMRRLFLLGGGSALLVLLFANSLLVILPLLILVFLFGLYTERRVSLHPDAGPGAARMYNMAFSFVIFVILMKSCLLALTMALVR